ncbi:MAG: hypothetical protein H0X69_15820 [Gemmatimonadales bacterium]|nr:hypothetical protein [Gemmatimonadales bacterium]
MRNKVAVMGSLAVLTLAAVGIGTGAASPRLAVDLPEHRSAAVEGYELRFHPAWLSAAVLRTPEGREIELYRQSAPYKLGAGEAVPGDHLLSIGEGPETVGLLMQDRAHLVKRITVEYYDGRVFTMDNGPVICPPSCF